MEIKDMKMEDIETRMKEINELLNDENCDIDALTAEVAELEARSNEIKEAVEKRNELASKVAAGNIGTVLEGRKQEELNNVENKNMNVETRKAEMVDALAEYIKGRASNEQRALLTLNAEKDGTIAISEIVDDFIWTDWDKSPILSRVRKHYVRGNYKVGYEASATGAVIHKEGAEAPAEEQLVIGYIDFVAEYFKKWIKVSDNVLALKGRAFLDYLFDEFGHQLAIALENAIVAEIASSDLSAKVTHALDGDAVLAAIAKLSDEASNPVVICSKETYATIKSIRTTAGARIEDPFEGLEVLFNNTVTGLLVGDLDGVIANFPDGEDFKFIVDDKTLATEDMVRIIGKVLVAIHLVRPNGFAVVTAA